ncbi:MAG TPA: hypothetical protein VNO21_00010 [Polyangiaceae bacterium]|nr:hypothetical protein [Polyangiaceae bacterium]
MKDDVKNRLNGILGSYDEKLAEIERRDTAIRAARESFPERFAVLKTKTIRPVLDEFAAALNARGHDAAAREQEESSSAAGGVAFAAVILRIIPKPFARKSETNNNFIEVAFSANRAERKITVASTNTIANSGGSRGKRGEYEIDSVTTEIVEGHVLQTLQEALAETR